MYFISKHTLQTQNKHLLNQYQCSHACSKENIVCTRFVSTTFHSNDRSHVQLFAMISKTIWLSIKNCCKTSLDLSDVYMYGVVLCRAKPEFEGLLVRSQSEQKENSSGAFGFLKKLF